MADYRTPRGNDPLPKSLQENRRDYMDTGAEGPESLYPSHPGRGNAPAGTDVGENDEFGNPTDAGDIENGYVVFNAFASTTTNPVLFGPYRTQEAAQREADDCIARNNDRIMGHAVYVIPLNRPFASPGVLLVATEREEERYNRIMAMDPAERTDEQEEFIELIGEALVGQTLEEAGF
jgi:hypothetical protein